MRTNSIRFLKTHQPGLRNGNCYSSLPEGKEGSRGSVRARKLLWLDLAALDRPRSCSNSSSSQQCQKRNPAMADHEGSRPHGALKSSCLVRGQPPLTKTLALLP